MFEVASSHDDHITTYWYSSSDASVGAANNAATEKPLGFGFWAFSSAGVALRGDALEYRLATEAEGGCCFEDDAAGDEDRWGAEVEDGVRVADDPLCTTCVVVGSEVASGFLYINPLMCFAPYAWAFAALDDDPPPPPPLPADPLLALVPGVLGEAPPPVDEFPDRLR